MLTQDDDLSRRSQYLINNICNFSGSAAQSEPELSFVMICQHRTGTMKKNILQRRRLEKEVPFLAPDCSTIFVRRAPQKNPIKDILNKKIEDPFDALDESFSTATDNSLTTTINEFFKNSDDVKMQDSGEELGYRSSSSISESDEPKVVHATQICNECETKNTIVKDLKKEIETKNKTIEGLNKENDEIAEATEKSLLGKKNMKFLERFHILKNTGCFFVKRKKAKINSRKI